MRTRPAELECEVVGTSVGTGIGYCRGVRVLEPQRLSLAVEVHGTDVRSTRL